MKSFIEPAAMPAVLLVEDDVVLRDRVLIPRLSSYGFPVQGIETVRELYKQAAQGLPGLVVLDVGLPDGDGFTTARWLREHFPSTGIVMLTGRGSPSDTVKGLTDGADAYLTKPVDVEVLVATLHSLVRRLGSSAPTRHEQQRSWHLDTQGWCVVSPSGVRMPLTKSERKLMARMMATRDKVVTRDQLIEVMTESPHEYDPHRIDSLIHRLRKKAQAIYGQDLPLVAVHGEGYVMTS